MSKFQIFKQEYPDISNPYVIIETYITSEGYRSRICSGRFPSKGIAMIEVNLKLTEMNK